MNWKIKEAEEKFSELTSTAVADTSSQLRQICVEEKYTIEIPTRVVT